MKTYLLTPIAYLILLTVSTQAAPLGTAFTYQGRLADGSNPAIGIYDFRFALFDSAAGGIQLGGVVTTNGVAVSNGLFTVTVDFGAAAFMGDARWLEIAVRTNGSASPHTLLLPRQPLTPAPYALHAANAGGLMTFVNQPLDIKVSGMRALRLEPTSLADTVNVIGGSAQNFVAQGVYGATISGGGSANFDGLNPNSVASRFGTIGGGLGNGIRSLAGSATISGGSFNFIQAGAFQATIGGGTDNTIQTNASSATIAGGAFNKIQTDAYYATIGGGAANTISNGSEEATIAGGSRNIIEDRASWASIGGGHQNAIRFNAYGAAVAGGFTNSIGNGASFGFVGGGRGNKLEAETDDATITGGAFNTVQTIAFGATIAGGIQNIIRSNAVQAAIGGGLLNISAGQYSTVSGGRANQTSGTGATVAGGELNETGSLYATVAGGYHNRALGIRCSIGGGAENYAASFDSTVGGGYGNTASGFQSTVPGGAANTASGDHSFAAGRRAKAVHAGTFAWADSADTDFDTIRADEFIVRARGGFEFFTSANYSTGVQVPAGGNAWAPACDRHTKENFEPVDERAVLEKVSSLPITEWNLKTQDASIRHVGPMAQDFRAAFGLGDDDKHISTVDADGVALAAIKGLNQKLEEAVRVERSRTEALEKTVAELKEVVSKLVGQQNAGGR